MTASAPRAPGGVAPLAVRTLDHCLVCGGLDLAPLAMAYEFRDRRFPAVECRGCGMRFLAVQPAPEAFAELYSAAYFAQDFRCGRSEAPAFDESAFRPENDALLAEFEALGPGRRLLELGSATGWLLKHAAERGWSARGVELSAEAVAHARGIGAEVFHGDLLAAALPASAFDLVYLGDVLEHVPDCRQVMDEIARVLAPQGHLYLRGPITTNSLGRRVALAATGVFGGTLVLREPPYHLWEFTPAALRGLVRRAGLTLVALRQSKIPPGRAHGSKSGVQRAAMAAFDAINLPLTRAFNRLGDRAVLIARRG